MSRDCGRWSDIRQVAIVCSNSFYRPNLRKVKSTTRNATIDKNRRPSYGNYSPHLCMAILFFWWPFEWKVICILLVVSICCNDSPYLRKWSNFSYSMQYSLYFAIGLNQITNWYINMKYISMHLIYIYKYIHINHINIHIRREYMIWYKWPPTKKDYVPDSNHSVLNECLEAIRSTVDLTIALRGGGHSGQSITMGIQNQDISV